MARNRTGSRLPYYDIKSESIFYYDEVNLKITIGLCSYKSRYRDNIIYLTGQPGDVFSPDPSSAGGVIIMSTYEEMQIILTIALLIVAILNLKNKK